MYVIREWGREDVVKVPDMHCPHCGEQRVTVEVSEGDYYVGPRHYCWACSSVWTIQGPSQAGDIITST